MEEDNSFSVALEKIAQLLRIQARKSEKAPAKDSLKKHQFRSIASPESLLSLPHAIQQVAQLLRSEIKKKRVWKHK